MAKVITVSRFYPSYHSKKGEPTYFVEKIYNSLGDLIPMRKNGFLFEQISELNFNLSPTIRLGFYDSINKEITEEKHHTIRLGKRWKTGDKASIRVWGDDINPKSGRKGAYHSKQIIITPDVEVTVYNVELWKQGSDCFIGQKVNENTHTLLSFGEVARNDGLDFYDLKEWFKLKEGVIIEAQIICWNKDLKY